MSGLVGPLSDCNCGNVDYYLHDVHLPSFQRPQKMLTVNIYMLEKVPNIIVAASVDHDVPEWRVGEGHGDGPLLRPVRGACPAARRGVALLLGYTSHHTIKNVQL